MAYIETLTGKPSHPRRKDAWKAMKGFWENIDPALVDVEMCESYRRTRQVGDATARYELMMLSTAFKWAGDKVTGSPKIWLPPKPDRKERHLTRRQWDRFIAGFVRPHGKLYAQIGVYTMARPGSILDLTWDRVDLERGMIDLNPPERARTNKKRPHVPIGPKLLKALSEAYEGRTSAYVIEHGGEQVASVKKAFLAASERSGVKATPYTLRHTGAVWAAEGRVPMSELAQMMGHDDSRTTEKHYARYSPDFLRGVASAIENEPEVKSKKSA